MRAHTVRQKIHTIAVCFYKEATLFNIVTSCLIEALHGIYTKMVRSCCAVGCTNRQEGEKKNLTFYRIPKGRTPIERRRRKDWVRAIRRADRKTWTQEQISKAYICAEHFISGDFVNVICFFLLGRWWHVCSVNDFWI